MALLSGKNTVPKTISYRTGVDKMDQKPLITASTVSAFRSKCLNNQLKAAYSQVPGPAASSHVTQSGTLCFLTFSIRRLDGKLVILFRQPKRCWASLIARNFLLCCIAIHLSAIPRRSKFC